MRKHAKPLLSAALMLALAACAAAPRPARVANNHGEQRVGIGAGEKDSHSHLSFPHLPTDLVRVSARVTVDGAPPTGLNYFAVQVNFANNTWAHGGIQLVNNRQQANWGGLVNRGGGSADYAKEDPSGDLLLIQNPPGDTHTGPYAWSPGKAYVITIERGGQVTLPPGDYVFIQGSKPAHIAVPRPMWEWRLTITPADGNGEVFQSTLYDAASTFKNFYVWNECGYGACGQNQHAAWTLPRYRTQSAPGHDVVATEWARF